MKLPNGENAYIPPSKLKDYLLSDTHPVGKSKAKFFRGLGFNESHMEMLERGLISIAHTEEVKEVESSPHGMKYVVEGLLPTPDGRQVAVRTVWIIETNQGSPRFVTAYPVEAN